MVVPEVVFTTAQVVLVEVPGCIADLVEVQGVILPLHGLPLEVVGIEGRGPEAVVVDIVPRVLQGAPEAQEVLEVPEDQEAQEVLEAQEAEVAAAVPQVEAEAVAEEEIKIQVQ